MYDGLFCRFDLDFELPVCFYTIASFFLSDGWVYGSAITARLKSIIMNTQGVIGSHHKTKQITKQTEE